MMGSWNEDEVVARGVLGTRYPEHPARTGVGVCQQVQALL
jgi:hypothetical protein